MDPEPRPEPETAGVDAKTANSEAREFGRSSTDAAGSKVESNGGGPSDLSSHPVADFLGITDSPTELKVVNLRLENFTAECMRKMGWEYVPVDRSEVIDMLDLGDEPAYGISRSYELVELPELLGNGSALGRSLGSDPNLAIVNSLSQSARETYHKDLDGPTLPPNDGSVGITNKDLGCRGEALSAIRPANSQAVKNRAFELVNEVNKSKVMQEATADWSACMKEQGWDFADREAPSNYVLQLKADFQLETDEFDVDGQLNGDEIDSLRRQEYTIFRLDNDCAQRSGWIDKRRLAERSATAILAAEFPDIDR